MFDYNRITDTNTRRSVQKRAAKIQTTIKLTAEKIVELGLDLIQTKEDLGHGLFTEWLVEEFMWGETTARNYMRVAEQFKTATVADLDISAQVLYLLARETTSTEARWETLEEARQKQNDNDNDGERGMTLARAQEIVLRHQPSAAREGDKQTEVITSKGQGTNSKEEDEWEYYTPTIPLSNPLPKNTQNGNNNSNTPPLIIDIRIRLDPIMADPNPDVYRTEIKKLGPIYKIIPLFILAQEIETLQTLYQTRTNKENQNQPQNG
jgi:hypothetical protein